MLSQILCGTEGLEQLVCDGKTLRGSAVDNEDGSTRSVAQVSVNARALGVAMAQMAYDTGQSHERAELQELLATIDLEGVLIQADAFQTTKSFFDGASPRPPMCCRRSPPRSC
jgi:hypothetical protein